jgi:transposase
MGLGISGQRQRQGAKRGELTGPNPTDRGKLGTKRHVLVDGQGIPLAVTLTGANVHDMHMVGETLDAVNVRASRGPRRPKNLCLDKGYDYRKSEQEARTRGVKPHIRRRGEPALTGPIRGKKPRRWVVERTNSWHNNFRALRIRWEKIAANHLALVHMACALITFQAAERANRF